MMFQRALPELKGFGVKIRIPGFKRSAQVVMCSGLPFGTTKTTTESVTMPFVTGLEFQFDETRSFATRRLHVGRGGEVHDVGRLAGEDGLGLASRGAVGLQHGDVLALRASC